jgi:hypothetical protein
MRTQIAVIKNSGGLWNPSYLPATSTGEQYSQVMVCDALKDYRYQIYAPSLNASNYIYQYYEYSGHPLSKSNIGRLNNSVLCTAYGDANKSGKLNLYSGCADGHIYQHTWGNTMAWENPLDIKDFGASTICKSIYFGDGDGNGEFELYCGLSSNKIVKVAYDGATWTASDVGPCYSTYFGIGDGDNDGQPEIYAGDQSGNVLQYKWQSFWTSSSIGSTGSQVTDIVVSDGDNDGKNEVYCTTADGHVYQFVFIGGVWQRTSLGVVSTSLQKIAIGDGDNDNQFETFALGADNKIYLFKQGPFVPTPTPTATSLLTTPTPAPDFRGRVIDPKYFYVYPNPTHGVNVKFRFFLPQSADVRIKIFTPMDRFIWETSGNYPAGWSELVWNASGMSNGVYFYIGEAWNDKGREKVVKKLVLLK